MYVCFLITMYFLSETKADGLANDSDVMMDVVADGPATCTWALRILMELDTERQTDWPIKHSIRWML